MKLMRCPLILTTLLVVTLLLPIIGMAKAANEDDTVVCCSASPVELYLIGSDSNKKLTPFASELGDEPQSISLETSISSQESLGRWVLADTWKGLIPASTWSFHINYEVSNAAGVQINATVKVNIGSKSFSAQTEPGSSFLPQGKGTLSLDIEVEELTTTGSSNIEVELIAQAVVFSVPGSEAKLDFFWGSEEDDSSIEATIPLLDILMVTPEIEGSDVYLAVRLDSPWGLSTLALAESITLRVNGNPVSGDPIETASGDTARVTWTWSGASGGTETINVEIELVFQLGQPSLKGSKSFEIETFDSGGGTGTYYPPDEPLRTDGTGSGLSVAIDIQLGQEGQELMLERRTKLTIDDELAFWMRWGMDHIGDDNPELSSTLRAFSSGAVTDDDRVSRFIEDVERAEFERQLVTLGPMYLNSGLGLDTEELFGDFRDFNEIKIEVDLGGESAVINHPVILRVTTTQIIDDGKRVELLRNFIIVQPAPLWHDIDIDLTATSDSFTALSSGNLRETDAMDLSVLRLPWGDHLHLQGEGLDQDEKFTLATVPTSSPVYAPLPLMALTALGIFGGIFVGLRLTRQRRRNYLYLEMIFVPLVLLIAVLGYPPDFVAIALGIAAFVWWVTAFASPPVIGSTRPNRTAHVPMIPCPACQTLNPVTSEERPHRFNCTGCQRIIKLVA